MELKVEYIIKMFQCTVKVIKMVLPSIVEMCQLFCIVFFNLFFRSFRLFVALFGNSSVSKER